MHVKLKKEFTWPHKSNWQEVTFQDTYASSSNWYQVAFQNKVAASQAQELYGETIIHGQD